MKLWLKCIKCGTIKQINGQKQVGGSMRAHAMASPACSIDHVDMITGRAFELLDADPNEKELVTNPAARL